jgi:glycosyltransferase involved in cell wall biosynthesis
MNNSILKKPIILIDGVFFQAYQTGIARLWISVLDEWSKQEFTQHILVLDRGNTIPRVEGIQYRTLPLYRSYDAESDWTLLQQICDEESADLFISTYYTTAINTPSVFMAYDMIPEVLEWNLDHPSWQQKHHAIRQAVSYIAISQNTARDLVKFFPEIDLDSITVALCGIKETFSPATSQEIVNFKQKYGIHKPYFILVGVSSDYKNSDLFFQAFSNLSTKQGFEVICVGKSLLEETRFRSYTSGTVVHQLPLTDEDLIAAYSGAVALVYPSKYEGFGLPILEAMACGCPVITCANASIPEVAGTAALYVDDSNSIELENALCDIQKTQIRENLTSLGLAQVKKFSWSNMADVVKSALIAATLQPLNLRDINLIVFPDWSMSEESLQLELENVLFAIASHPDRSSMTLLIEMSDTSEENANLTILSVSMNLLMKYDLDVEAGPEISLVGQLGEIQWTDLLKQIHKRIIIKNDNDNNILKLRSEQLSSCQINDLSQSWVSSNHEAQSQ